jgi:hypothetical protein
MATITVDCSTAGESQAMTIKSLANSQVQVAEIFVTPSGTYDTGASESIEITNADQAIENSRRNGKAVTLLSACGGQSAYDAAADKHWHFKTAVVSSTTVECTIFEVGGSEHSNSTALPTFSGPMSVLVAFTEA